jgi:YcxB-like protein
MEVEYELTLEDISAFHAYYRRHAPASHRRIDPIVGVVILISCILYGLALLTVLALGVGSFWVPILIGAWAGALIASIFDTWHFKWMASRMSRKALEYGRDAEKVLGWCRVILDPQGIHVTSQFSTCLYLWNGIEKIATTDEHLFIYVTTGSAQVVPLRAFADGRAFDSFVDMAKRYHSMGGVGEGAAWVHHGATGIQAPDPSGKSGTVEGIVSKESDPRQG